jgi:hypothetical protein
MPNWKRRLPSVLCLLLLAACAGLPPPAGKVGNTGNVGTAATSGTRETGRTAAAPDPADWQALAPGLDHWQGEPGLHALRVDLRQRRLRLTPHAERGRTLDAFDGARQALAALNASFFDRSFRARGLSSSEGEPWPEPLAAQDSPLLACDAAQVCRLQLDPPYALPPGTRLAVAGTPWLLRAGRPRQADDDARCEAFCARPHPRTALGLSADGATLYLLLAEGRRAGVPGLSLAVTAEQLRRLGAHEGINLDGGGSSALLLRGEWVMRRPDKEPALRRLANALLVQ